MRTIPAADFRRRVLAVVAAYLVLLVLNGVLGITSSGVLTLASLMVGLLVIAWWSVRFDERFTRRTQRLLGPLQAKWFLGLFGAVGIFAAGSLHLASIPLRVMRRRRRAARRQSPRSTHSSERTGVRVVDEAPNATPVAGSAQDADAQASVAESARRRQS